MKYYITFFLFCQSITQNYLKGLIFLPKNYIIYPERWFELKEEILDILKNADGYISGERISEMLNVSRTAIWKHIKSLRESGYKIESVTNKGLPPYFLARHHNRRRHKKRTYHRFYRSQLIYIWWNRHDKQSCKGKQHLARRQCIYRRSTDARQRQSRTRLDFSKRDRYLAFNPFKARNLPAWSFANNACRQVLPSARLSVLIQWLNGLTTLLLTVKKSAVF